MSRGIVNSERSRIATRALADRKAATRRGDSDVFDPTWRNVQTIRWIAMISDEEISKLYEAGLRRRNLIHGGFPVGGQYNWREFDVIRRTVGECRWLKLGMPLPLKAAGIQPEKYSSEHIGNSDEVYSL